MAEPAVTPVTVPMLLMVAVAGLLLLHVPPVTVEVIAVVLPVQTAAAPLMVPAVAPVVTVTAAVAVDVPQALLTE